MTYKTEILNWWLNLDPFTDEELKFLDIPRNDHPEINEDKYTDLEIEYFNHLKMSNLDISNYTISFEKCATDFINLLFDEYVDDKTLVITTENEHENVTKRANLCKNVIKFTNHDIRTNNIRKIVPLLSKYKKAFVYIIGTHISTGEITPQQFLINLKQSLKRDKLPNIFVLDDVHGMFLVPRDYTLFDYILNTAHALIKGYDVGILISNKNKKQFGIRAYNWGKDYLNKLDLLFTRKDKLLSFKNVCEEYFYEYISKNYDKNILPIITAPHIFSMDIPDLQMPEELFNMFRQYHIRFEGLEQNSPKIRLRAAQCLHHPALFKEGIQKLEEILPHLIS